jgi:mannan polymerase II complex MNN10 subunit
MMIIGTPFEMSLSRSPSPRADGGWSSPGLSSSFGEGSALDGSASAHRSNGNGNSVTWEGAKKKSAIINGGLSGPNGGFFNRHMRSISNSLPNFNMGGGEYSYAEKEKLGRGRWSSKDGTWHGRIRMGFWKAARKMKKRYLIFPVLLFLWMLFYVTRKSSGKRLLKHC